jgi:hypothetical protein
MQAIFWAMAGISAIPFGIAGERSMFILGLASVVLAQGTIFIAIAILWRRRWARRVTFVIEGICLAGALSLMALPIGANHGLVAWLTNVGLPMAVVIVLWKRFEPAPTAP